MSEAHPSNPAAGPSPADPGPHRGRVGTGSAATSEHDPDQAPASGRDESVDQDRAPIWEQTGPDHGYRPDHEPLADAERPPVDITPGRSDDLGRADPDGAGGRPSRHRLIVLGSALIVALAGAAGLGSAGWRIAQQKDAAVDTPTELAGLTRDDSDGARSTAEYLRTGLGAKVDLDRSVGAVYADPADPRRSVLLAAGTALIWRPDRGLAAALDLVSDNEGAVAGLREVPPGDLGGVMKCGTSASQDGDITVCGWADHGSVALAMFPGRTVDESAGLLRAIRGSVQTRS
jgi:hypothetical protein